MNPRQSGFLLLSSHLGNPQRKPLTVSQLRTLADRVRWAEVPVALRELTVKDLMALGCGINMAEQIVSLLGDEDILEFYVTRAARMGCRPITRADERYPAILRQRLGLDSPGCLWAKGDISILNTQAIALVGSRELWDANREFARRVGQEAARQGLTLVSGNARGADRTAQEACLNAGGKVISVVADELSKQPERENLLYLSEEDFDAPFSTQRALSRNRCIHCLGIMVFVAQSTFGKGGTWDGTVRNLRHDWSMVACYDDGSQAAAELTAMGAYGIGLNDLDDLSIFSKQYKLF